MYVRDYVETERALARLPATVTDGFYRGRADRAEVVRRIKSRLRAAAWAARLRELGERDIEEGNR